jgi:hypothetical protein
MKRALWLGLALVACKPPVDPGPFLCGQKSDCSPSWFCGHDKHCHDESVGEALDCGEDGICGSDWHCGPRQVCYDREVDNEGRSCRRTKSNADSGFAGGDCGDLFRCGVDGLCHPGVDAGAIPCSYAADFADCTDGWRCSFNGVCLDPAGEALQPYSRQFAAPQLIRNALGASATSSVSEASQKAMTVAMLDDGGLRLVQRLLKPSSMGQPSAPDDFSQHVFVTTQLSTTGTVSAPLVAGIAMATFFENGFVARAGVGSPSVNLVTTDGGTLRKAPGAGTRTVSELRALSGEWVAAFAPLAAGYWIIPPQDGGAFWVDVDAGLGLLDVLELPNKNLEPPCALVVTVASDGGFPNVVRSGVSGGPPCPVLPDFPAPGYSAGRVQVGLRPGQVPVPLASVNYTLPTGSSQSTDVLGFAVSDFSTVETSPGCFNACGSEARVSQFWPYEPLPFQFRAEILCEPTGDAGVTARWWAVVDPTTFQCVEQRIDRRARRFLDTHTNHAAAPSRNGAYARYEPNFVTGNGQVWLGQQGANSFEEAEPWFIDRPPLAMGDFTVGFLPDGGPIRVILSSGGTSTAVLTKDGFVSDPQALGIVDGILAPTGIVGFTSHGELVIPLDGRVLARVSQFPFPEQADQHAILVPRPNGAEWVVSVNDQLFTGTFAGTGRVVDLLPAALPNAGFPIVSIVAANTYKPGAATVDFYAATRSGVYRVYLDPFNRWRVDEIRIDSSASFVKVWMTSTNRARAGDAAGNVFSLPSGLLLAHGLATPAQDFLSTCGRDIGLFADDAYALGPADGGVASWQPLGLIRDALEGGRLFQIDDGVLAFSARGDAQHIVCSGP